MTFQKIIINIRCYHIKHKICLFIIYFHCSCNVVMTNMIILIQLFVFYYQSLFKNYLIDCFEMLSMDNYQFILLEIQLSFEFQLCIRQDIHFKSVQTKNQHLKINSKISILLVQLNFLGLKIVIIEMNLFIDQHNIL